MNLRRSDIFTCFGKAQAQVWMTVVHMAAKVCSPEVDAPVAVLLTVLKLLRLSLENVLQTQKPIFDEAVHLMFDATSPLVSLRWDPTS
jgi:hypothetical protein